MRRTSDPLVRCKHPTPAYDARIEGRDATVEDKGHLLVVRVNNGEYRGAVHRGDADHHGQQWIVWDSVYIDLSAAVAAVLNPPSVWATLNEQESEMKQLSVVVAFVLTAITAFKGFAGEAPQQDEEPPTLSAICSPEHAAVDEAFKRDYSGLTPFCELRPDQQRSQLNKATAAVREHFNPRCASLTPRNRGNRNRICFPVVEGFELSVMAANIVELPYESDPHTGGSNTHGLYRLGRIVDGFERRVTAIYHPTETTNKALHLTGCATDLW